MGRVKRIKDHKKRAMKKRLINQKGPMTPEEKKARKEKREAQRAESKALNAAKEKAKK